MGFLKKIVKKVKKGIKKIGSGVKKVFKKLKKSKLLKTIAIVGAALVTGGAAVGAFGGSLASSTIGKALIASKNFIMGIPGVSFVAKPFEYAGTMLGTGAGKVTEFLGVTTEAGRQYVPGVSESVGAADVGKVFDAKTGVEIPLEELGTKTAEELAKEAATTSTAGQIIGDIARGVGTSVATGAAMQYIQGEPEPVGAVGAGLGEERGINLTPLEVAYAQSGVDLSNIYNNLTFGTADPGFLSSSLYQQPTIGVA